MCPGDQVCVAGLDACFDPGAIDACDGKGEGEACEVDGRPGACGSGACITATCGDGMIDPPEVCDDGNAIAGDGCSADCLVASCLVPVSHRTVQAVIDDPACPIGHLVAGTYTENVTITGDVALERSGDGEAIIDGGGAATTVVIDGGNVVLRDLTITGGQAEEGGGLVNRSTLTLERVTVRDNLATSRGGGIFNEAGFILLNNSRVVDNRTDSDGTVHGAGIATLAPMSITNASEISGNQLSGLIAFGAGLYAEGTSVIVSSASFTSNRVEATSTDLVIAFGGAIYLVNSNLSIDDTELSSNQASATSESSGAITGAAGIGVNNSSVQGRAVIATGNSATAMGASPRVLGGGGGVLGGSTAGLVDSAITDNSATLASTAGGTFEALGGGLYINSESVVDVQRTVILRNQVTGNGSSVGLGGGIAVEVGGDLTVLESLVGENQLATPTGLGAGVFIESTSFQADVQIQRSAIVDNSGATGGAGLMIQASLDASVTISDSTISGNTGAAGCQGGGVLASELGGGVLSLQLTHVTVAGNQADSGGGLALTDNNPATAPSATAISSIIAENTANTGPQCATGGLVLDGDFNVISDTADCSLDAAATSNQVAAPALGELADNGGFTPTHALPSGSPAIDAGDPNRCTAVDQRGLERPDMMCDAGAFERQ